LIPLEKSSKNAHGEPGLLSGSTGHGSEGFWVTGLCGSAENPLEPSKIAPDLTIEGSGHTGSPRFVGLHTGHGFQSRVWRLLESPSLFGWRARRKSRRRQRFMEDRPPSISRHLSLNLISLSISLSALNSLSDSRHLSPCFSPLSISPTLSLCLTVFVREERRKKK
jgi:hypothetical protein